MHIEVTQIKNNPKKLGGSGPLPGLPDHWGTIRGHCGHHVSTAPVRDNQATLTRPLAASCLLNHVDLEEGNQLPAGAAWPGPQNQCKMLKIGFGGFRDCEPSVDLTEHGARHP